MKILQYMTNMVIVHYFFVENIVFYCKTIITQQLHEQITYQNTFSHFHYYATRIMITIIYRIIVKQKYFFIKRKGNKCYNIKLLGQTSRCLLFRVVHFVRKLD